ncbi:serine/threonine protein kinase [Streptomyces sp. 3211.6]|uniref:serine/threonine-protein kinase n=1 Tax=Streptomyces sp. 3211.6 TaxID=1938845 RepID=UPI000EAC3219|nr:serine/threonine-protein kinase [Streptomyces sp. 3211.6]RKT03533.1 serine/threonine protein kinase [Streptomyces sp. 3211.6]
MTGRDDAVGRVIAGRYRLQRKLGVGGMGRVWLAHDRELACDVAIKEIAFPPDTPRAERESRINRARGEARHSARLRGNPHVVTVYDVVEEEGLPWIVMEYVPGASDLGRVVDEYGPLPPAETARIGLAVLDALSQGHRLGILHRDVKPANILLTGPVTDGSSAGDGGRVMLADYGIALQQDSGEPRLTTASGVIGTPRYIAPERAHGSAPTAASDLFSLGATLYFAVEGQGPFDRDSDVSTLTALLFEEPSPPRRAADLSPVLLGLLSKDPGQRLDGETAARRLAVIGTEPQRTPAPPPPEPPTHVVPTPDQAPTRTAPHRPPARQEPAPPVPPGPEKSRPRPPAGPLPTRRNGPVEPGGRPSRKGRWIVATTAAAAVLLVGGILWATLPTHESAQNPSTDAASPAVGVNAWAKRFCDPAQPQLQKISNANAAIQRASAAGAKPADVKRTDSQAFQQISEAYGALSTALRNAGAPPVKDGPATQQGAVKEYEDRAAAYADMKERTDALDANDQAKFAEGLQAVADQLKSLHDSSGGAVQKLESGESGAALSAQPGCQA